MDQPASIRNISELHEWDNNPRSINEADLERLKQQIELLGQYKPLLAMPDGTILGGNMRLKAISGMGITSVWVSTIDFVERDGIWYAVVNGVEQKKRFASKEDGMMEYALSDNDRAGFYDDEKLRQVLANLNIDSSLYAVDLSAPLNLEDVLKKLADQTTTEDEPPAIDETNVISKPGEIYQLGKHRLICGDATNLDHITKLMNGVQADMIFTDPPYNVDYTGKTKDALKIENDKKTDGDFYQFLLDSYTNMNVASKSGASIYVCHADSEGLNFRKAFLEAGFLLKQCIIWNKNSLVMGRQDYQWKHEPILYGWKEGESHTFFGGRDKTTVWNIDRPTASTEHPTMKPIALIAEALRNSSKGGDIILDTFGGSGSTLIACQELDRTCYMSELDPKYCDVIRKRYAKFINREADWEAATPVIDRINNEKQEQTPQTP